MNLPDNITVVPGCIKVVSVDQLYGNDRVQIWTIDASTKYYQLDHTSYFDNDVAVILSATENTIKMDEDHLGAETSVVFHFYNDENWQLFSCNTSARYELRLCFYRFGATPIEIQV